MSYSICCYVWRFKLISICSQFALPSWRLLMVHIQNMSMSDLARIVWVVFIWPCARPPRLRIASSTLLHTLNCSTPLRSTLVRALFDNLVRDGCFLDESNFRLLWSNHVAPLFRHPCLTVFDVLSIIYTRFKSPGDRQSKQSAVGLSNPLFASCYTVEDFVWRLF